MANTNGIIALTLGILGLCCGWAIALLIPPVGLSFPIIAIIYGRIGIKKDDSKRMAIAGLILGVLALISIILAYTVLALIIFGVIGG